MIARTEHIGLAVVHVEELRSDCIPEGASAFSVRISPYFGHRFGAESYGIDRDQHQARERQQPPTSAAPATQLAEAATTDTLPGTVEALFRRGNELAFAENYRAALEVYGALVLGTRDYVQKNGFRGAVLGLSGGIDSALTLAIAVDALGAGAVTAVSLPSRYTAGMSNEDAEIEARMLGVDYHRLPIEPAFDTFLHTLEPLFAGLAPDTTEENIQARCRGVLLMALSNKTGKLVLTTSNKSETAVGYSTLYGDMAGGFAPIKDVPKTLERETWEEAGLHLSELDALRRDVQSLHQTQVDDALADLGVAHPAERVERTATVGIERVVRVHASMLARRRCVALIAINRGTSEGAFSILLMRSRLQIGRAHV